MMAGKHLEQMQEIGQRSHQQLRQRRNANVDGRATTVEALIGSPAGGHLKLLISVEQLYRTQHKLWGDAKWA